jgi:hypothetical protein
MSNLREALLFAVLAKVSINHNALLTPGIESDHSE